MSIVRLRNTAEDGLAHLSNPPQSERPKVVQLVMGSVHIGLKVSKTVGNRCTGGQIIMAGLSPLQTIVRVPRPVAG